VNILTIGVGASMTWTSPYLPLLQSKDKSPLGQAISANQASWVGSLLAIGALGGSYSSLAGFMRDLGGLGH
jgi:hypothetical protein